jgi:8-oxo-dGTP pyrophosphatase MutT (NUDIX family)
VNTPDAPAWLQQARAQAVQPPLRPRVPFWIDTHLVGSVEPGVLEGLHGLVQPHCRDGQSGWVLQQGQGDASSVLHQLALALRDAGRAAAWRHEQLPVCACDGQRLATVERAVVRTLGIATKAVHLMASTPDGRMWVQQRSLRKPNDPGRWDTLMGGMVSAADDLPQALARETWEEAGLRLNQLQALVYGGCMGFRRPSGGDGNEQDIGYTVEGIDWFHALLPPGVVPHNQDGEVEQFVLLERAALGAMLAQGRFTLEATLVIAAFLDG